MKKLYIVALLILNVVFCISSMEIDLQELPLDQQLIEVARQGDIESIKKLVANGASLDAKTDYGNNLLHLSVYHDNAEVTKFFIKKHVEIDAINEEGQTPFFLAVDQGSRAAIDLLILHGADVNAQDTYGLTPLSQAAVNDDLKTMDFLISKGVDTNFKNNEGWTSLHWATFQGNIKATGFLIRHGASVGIKDSNSNTPLYLCLTTDCIESEEDRIKLVTLLLTEAKLLEESVATRCINDNEKIQTFKELALISTCDNLKLYDHDTIQLDFIIGMVKEQRKKIASIIPLNNEKFKRLLYSKISKVDDLERKRLQNMKDALEERNNCNETVSSVASDKQYNILLKMVAGAISADSFQKLPIEIKENVEESIIREVLAGNSGFTL